jgi:pyrimidine-nucleoside phosphorylase/thymidine phosphorylase
MSPYRTVQRKRDGFELTPAEITSFMNGYRDGHVAEYQVAAFLMAVFFRGLTTAELHALVEVMLRSGDTVVLDDVPGIKVDKHSTGGVGDKVSLILAPLVASLGVPVPMMSGRGLGHSGGTVDKLESIPGFRTDLTLAAFRAQMKKLGCALIAQTDEIAPLDRSLYALRDVTATVESIPLIASSIMSKKLAEGLDALVLDVKAGNGAFMPEPARAEELARTMIAIGESYGKRVVAYITAMDRPLGTAVGNALEVIESVECLRGGGPADLREVTLTLAAEMVMLGDGAPDRDAARSMAAAALDDGRALERFRQIVRAQGGDVSAIDDTDRLPAAPIRVDVAAARTGTVTAIDVRAIGLAAVALGAGRANLKAVIDPAVGFLVHVKPGDSVERGHAIAQVHAADEDSAARAVTELSAAITIGDGDAAFLPLIGPRITASR